MSQYYRLNRAMTFAQPPFPVWVLNINVGEDALSATLRKRMQNAALTLFGDNSVDSIFHRLMYDIYEQLKREMAILIERGDEHMLDHIDVIWQTINISIYRNIRDL